MARTSAPKPAAEEARPAAVGKLFAVTIRNGQDESLGNESSFASSFARRVRSEDMHACVRGLVTSSGEPLRVSSSAPEYLGEVEAVVCVLRDFWESVTLREEFVGRLSLTTRFPQYLFAWSDSQYDQFCVNVLEYKNVLT